MERLYRTRLYKFLENIWIGWISILFGVGAILAATFFSILIFGSVYEIGWSLWHDDWTNWKRIASKKTEQTVVIQDFGDEAKRLSESLLAETGKIRAEIENRISGANTGTAGDRQLLSRVTNLEEMLKIKPEEVASIAIQGQRLVSLESNLLQVEARLQTQITNLYTLVLGLFGALVVTVLATAIWSTLSGKKSH